MRIAVGLAGGMIAEPANPLQDITARELRSGDC